MTNNEVQISVIVPTFNRARTLRNCIESLLRQTLAPQFYEIIIVDNNSQDDTAEMVEEFVALQTHDIHYVLEPRKGLHYTRHAGAKVAHSEILAFTDDDVICDERWLEELLKTYSDATVGSAGGKIIIRWDREPPQWVTQYEVVLGRLDYGPEPRILQNNQLINGGNFSIRKHILRDVGGFNPDQVGEVLVGDGEVGLCYKLHRHGIRIAWVPDAVVWHCQVVSKNATLRDLKRRFSNNGISSAYSFYEEYPTRAHLIWLAIVSLRQAARLQFLSARSRLKTRNYDNELYAAYFRAKAIHALKMLFIKQFREYNAELDWLE